MGQKINSKLFRLGYKKNQWDTHSYESSILKLSHHFFQEIEIKKYLNRIFNFYKIIIQKYKFFNTGDTIIIVLNYYISVECLKFIKNLMKKKEIALKSEENYSKKNKRKRLWILKYLKKKFFINSNLFNVNFFDIIILTLKTFIPNARKFNCILQNVNKGFSVSIKTVSDEEKSFKRLILQLRKYNRSFFYKEFVNALTILNKFHNSSKLLAVLISKLFEKIKRHNFFLNFLKRFLILIVYSSISKIKGIKILIKGRFNRRPRSKQRLVQIGKVALQTLDSNISYSCSTAFSIFGTFGIKVWVLEK